MHALPRDAFLRRACLAHPPNEHHHLSAHPHLVAIPCALWLLFLGLIVPEICDYLCRVAQQSHTNALLDASPRPAGLHQPRPCSMYFSHHTYRYLSRSLTCGLSFAANSYAGVQLGPAANSPPLYAALDGSNNRQTFSPSYQSNLTAISIVVSGDEDFQVELRLFACSSSTCDTFLGTTRIHSVNLVAGSSWSCCRRLSRDVCCWLESTGICGVCA